MSEPIGLYVDTKIIPAIWANPDTAFPEMKFRKNSRGDLKSDCHLNGDRDKSPKGGTTYIYENRPYVAIEHARGDSRQLISWHQERKGLPSYYEALMDLAKLYGIPLPEGKDRDKWEAYFKRQSALRAATEEFSRNLWAETDGAREAREYLLSRGCTEEVMEYGKIGLATPETWAKYKEEIAPDSKETRIGSIYRIAYPYLCGPNILGIKFRVIGNPPPGVQKTTNTKGLPKGEAFFRIGGRADSLVIVEGEMDALQAQARGADNVVATAGGPATKGQLEDAMRRGVRRITLLYDNDSAGRKDTEDTIPIARALGIETYIASLPEGSNDPDEYFAGGHSIEDFNGLIRAEVSVPMYEYRKLSAEYKETYKTLKPEEREGPGNEYSDKVCSLLSEAKLYSRELILQAIGEDEAATGQRAETFRNYLDQNEARIRDRELSEAVRKASGRIEKAIGAGDTAGALRIMKETAEKGREKASETDYARVFAPMTTEEATHLLQTIEPGIPTGYKFEKRTADGKNVILTEELTLNPGLTFICGYRGHGKTSFLCNLALNEVQRILERESGQHILFFSYEINKRRVLADLLNTYVNDPGISRSPLNTIEAYFRTGRFCGANYSSFLQGKGRFLSQVIGSGTLRIVEENYKVERLIEAIRYHLRGEEGKVSVIYIDYAQLLYSEDYSRQRIEEIKRVVNDLKDFSNSVGIPFVLAAQFNRDVVSPLEVTTDNIGEGGDFERIADTCIGLFNLKELRSECVAKDN
ncbi:MAG: toprim domain-containing protein, partial [Clostridia bacterium]|nr:toprim domain-containing protein [Clostridia bacterium]